MLSCGYEIYNRLGNPIMKSIFRSCNPSSLSFLLPQSEVGFHRGAGGYHVRQRRLHGVRCQRGVTVVLPFQGSKMDKSMTLADLSPSSGKRSLGVPTGPSDTRRCGRRRAPEPHLEAFPAKSLCKGAVWEPSLLRAMAIVVPSLFTQRDFHEAIKVDFF